MVVTSNFSTT
jgi:AAA domain